MKKRIITIAGAIGSGKSSTAKEVAAVLGYRHFSSGDLFRAIAKERGISIEEINLQAELEQAIDHAVDEQLRLLNTEIDFVIDSRLAFHWMPDSFKVYLSLDPKIAAERIYANIQKEGRVSQKAASVEEVLHATLERRASEVKRYQELYGIAIEDLTPFDFVIDTGTHDFVATTSAVLAAYREWLNA